jgi:hypothetical protein
VITQSNGGAAIGSRVLALRLAGSREKIDVALGDSDGDATC